jgi:hypothetical protein
MPSGFVLPSSAGQQLCQLFAAGQNLRISSRAGLLKTDQAGKAARAAYTAESVVGAGEGVITNTSLSWRVDVGDVADASYPGVDEVVKFLCHAVVRFPRGLRGFDVG